MSLKRTLLRQVKRHGVACTVTVPGAESYNENTLKVTTSGDTAVPNVKVGFSDFTERDLEGAPEVEATDRKMVVVKELLGTDLVRDATVEDGSGESYRVEWLRVLRERGTVVGWIAAGR